MVWLLVEYPGVKNPVTVGTTLRRIAPTIPAQAEIIIKFRSPVSVLSDVLTAILSLSYASNSYPIYHYLSMALGPRPVKSASVGVRQTADFTILVHPIVVVRTLHHVAKPNS